MERGTEVGGMSSGDVFTADDVVQFNEAHKWCGCLGFVNEVRDCGSDVRYMIGVPLPEQGTAYIYSMASALEFERVGRAVLLPAGGEE